jgi:hypothetical protein
MKQIHSTTAECDENCSCGKYLWVYDEQGGQTNEEFDDAEGIYLLLARHTTVDHRRAWSVEIRIPYDRLALDLKDYY